MPKRWVSLLLTALLIAGMAACTTPPQPFEYHDDRDAKQGPGLFSGDEAGYVIHGESSEEGKKIEKSPPDSDPQKQ